MAITSKITSVVGALVLAVGAATANEGTTEADTTTTYGAELASAERPLFANPFDPSTWYDAADGMDHAEMGKPEDFNMAHPSFWMEFRWIRKMSWITLDNP